MPSPEDATFFVNGSYIVLSCASGYMNNGGSLNVTCNTDGTWSQFPNCVSSTQTTRAASPGLTTCPYSSSLLTLTNGYASNWNSVYVSTPNQALSGSFIDYICMATYTLVGNSRMICTNGNWSAQPVCIGNL